MTEARVDPPVEIRDERHPSSGMADAAHAVADVARAFGGPPAAPPSPASPPSAAEPGPDHRGARSHRLGRPDPTRQVLFGITTIPWRFVLRRAARQFFLHKSLDAAGALSFFTVLATVPSLLAVVSLLGVFDEAEHGLRIVLGILRTLGLDEAVESLRGPLGQLVAAPHGSLLFALGLAGALWSASGYVGAFGRAINRMYGVEEGRRFWWFRAASLVITIYTIVLIGGALLLLFTGGDVAADLGRRFGVATVVVFAWQVFRWPVIVLFAFAAVIVLYHWSPNIRHPHVRLTSVGTLLAIGIWAVATLGFAFYVTDISTYNRTYGAFGAIIVGLLWVLLTNLALLFGAEVDAELERGRQLAAGIHAEETIRVQPRSTATYLPRRRRNIRFIQEAERLREQQSELSRHAGEQARLLARGARHEGRHDARDDARDD